MMRVTLLVQLLLVSTCLSACLSAAVDKVTLDSINKDIEDIKTILKSNLNQTSTTIRHSYGHFIDKGELTKDKMEVRCSQPSDGDSIYQYSIEKLNQSLGEIKFADYKGKPILIVNVATFCESTIEYPLYNQLKDKYGDDLVIVAFPCNQFWNQEPTGDAEEIYNAIKYVRPGKGFVPKFPLTKRIDVNGADQHPIYSFLKRSCPSTRTRFIDREHLLLYRPKNSRDVRWNFEKFLIEPRLGTVWKRYDQKYLPDRITADIEQLIEESKKISQG